MPDPSRVTFVEPAAKRWQGRKFKSWLVKITATVVLVVFVTVSLHGHWPLALALICCGLGFWWLNEVWRRYCERMEVLEEVDSMSSSEFAQYAAELLRTQGYTPVTSGRTTQPPADLLLSRGKESIACWLYHGRGPVRVEVVAKAAATMHSWKDWQTIVFASQRFTVAAWYRARREGCVLSNRDRLATLVSQHQRGHRVLAFPYEETTRLRGRR